ncbi:hypothetical protein R1flu_007560 [Riccia fluitans]|uniref:Uncharacterized protein n=1 Tax=Riccia fluitans TaxID=41844 RepID=A0ABD1YZS0_9MARC
MYVVDPCVRSWRCDTVPGDGVAWLGTTTSRTAVSGGRGRFVYTSRRASFPKFMGSFRSCPPLVLLDGLLPTLPRGLRLTYRMRTKGRASVPIGVTGNWPSRRQFLAPVFVFFLCPSRPMLSKVTSRAREGRTGLLDSDGAVPYVNGTLGMRVRIQASTVWRLIDVGRRPRLILRRAGQIDGPHLELDSSFCNQVQGLASSCRGGRYVPMEKSFEARDPGTAQLKGQFNSLVLRSLTSNLAVIASSRLVGSLVICPDLPCWVSDSPNSIILSPFVWPLRCLFPWYAAS